MKRSLLYISAVLLCSSCGTNLAMRGDGSREMAISLEEMRMELADVKHAFSNSTQVEISILEDKLEKIRTTLFFTLLKIRLPTNFLRSVN